MFYRPRILIVEDEEGTLERLKWILSKPPREWIKDTNCEGFEVDTATTFEEACFCLEKWKTEKIPYEAVLLDLCLPTTKIEVLGHKESEDNGRVLVEKIKKNMSEVSIVIITNYPTIVNLIHCIKHGVTDFLIKPIYKEPEAEKILFMRLIKAVGATREKRFLFLMSERLLRISNKQIKQLYNRISRYLTEQSYQVSLMINEISSTLMQRYGLDMQYDKQDTICKALNSIKEIVNQMESEIWQESNNKQQEVVLQHIDITNLINYFTSSIFSTFLYHDINLTLNIEKDLKTKSVLTDINEIVQELILGSLSSIIEKSEPKKNIIHISACYAKNNAGRDIEVSSICDAAPIRDEVLQSLQNGDIPQIELFNFERTLIYIWWIARNIGIRVNAGIHEEKAFIKIHIPVIVDE